MEDASIVGQHFEEEQPKTIRVTNIVYVDDEVTTKVGLSTFFSYCGIIAGMEVSEPDEEGICEAVVTFEGSSAVRTALVLDGTKMNEKKLNIVIANEGVVADTEDVEGIVQQDFEGDGSNRVGSLFVIRSCCFVVLMLSDTNISSCFINS
eukprot:TRINITY_DN1138_c0_g1_i3.p1 TRINITY_DN1138_c0_g1~~TRINITY_DN1138_c0_g1_i3.p1  ORF type:complete len:150 (-),score=41.11 TRINITY_DN1138_c0_g1_i3:467-916(-)